ncbi:la-related protein 1-like [Agrilus planipennis]|uniref:La-related protein 1-like n=1 Tax=Agrilus planipennis TaxID=224129 RepID=A0A7F5R7L6_AGRPL|nr:la-related protein 1-like [Agrilus planipennis]
MSTQVELTGTSYAHVVLSFKAVEDEDHQSNKENLELVSQSSDSSSNKKKCLSKSYTDGMVNSSLDDGGNFTPVVSHCRKERKHDKKRDKFKGKESHDKQKHAVSDRNNTNVEKRENSNREMLQNIAVQENNKKSTNEVKKVFVEAPLPKVNPWQVNKNATQAMSSKEVCETTESIVHKVTNGEPWKKVQSSKEQKASEFSGASDWPSLGNCTLEKKGLASKQGSVAEHEEDSSDKKRKTNKQKWVPLEIDLAKGNPRENSPKKGERHNSDVHMSDNEHLCSYAKDSDSALPKKNLPREGKSRSRGTKVLHYNRSNARANSESKYSSKRNENLEHTQYERADGFLMPYMGMFYFGGNSYNNLDSPTLKDYIKKQM